MRDVGTDVLSVFVAADVAFSMQLAALIASLRRSQTSPHGVLIAHEGFSDADRTRVSSAAGPDQQLVWLDAARLDTTGVVLPEFLKRPTLFRLLLDRLVPSEVERLVYLDADMVVRRPLDAAFRIELGDGALGAVREAKKPWIGAPPHLPFSSVGVDPRAPYFNAGTLVVDVPRFRAAKVGSRSLALLERFELPYGDQDALNLAVAGQWARIPPTFNLQSFHLDPTHSFASVTEPEDELGDALSDPSIVHFNHSDFGRPWVAGCTHPWADAWYSALDDTPWKGWRPDDTPLPEWRRRMYLVKLAVSRS